MLATFTVTNDDDAPVNTPAAVGTLRQAIADAENLAGHDIIVFSTNPAHGLNGAIITLDDGELSISESVTIDASMLTSGITIKPYDPTPGELNFDSGRIFNISGGEVELKGLTLTGGEISGAGGAIYA